MMPRINIIHCIVILLGQVTFAVAEAFPETLTIQIKNDHQIITLNWKKTEQFMANNNLPIWRALRNKEPELIPNVMSDIGPFAMYHDVDKSSAVILFQYQQRIFGVVDTRFWISALPLSEVGPNIQHTVGGRYVKRREDEDFHDKFYDFPAITEDDISYVNSFINEERSSESRHSHGSSLPSNVNVHDKYLVINPQAGPSNEHQNGRTLHQVDDTLYAEILVFITNDVVRHFTRKDPDLKLLVAYYLIHFNAVDMLFAKLRDHIKIHINIAGLVLESQIMAFPYAFMPSNERPLRVLDGDATLGQFPIYIKKYENVFPRDSFDFFYVSTHYTIKDEGEERLGLSIAVDNFAIRRDSNVKYQASGVIVERKPIYSSYVTSAHELAHEMDVEHDPTTEGKICDGDQCFAILQETGTYCRNCIRWSDQSINEFKAYIRSNLNHCFLLNEPRSLQPYGTPLVTIGPNRQCTCYGYQSHLTTAGDFDRVNPHHCNAQLSCTHNNQRMSYPLPKPIDGTPCGPQKVCWREECQPLEMPPIVQLLNYN